LIHSNLKATLNFSFLYIKNAPKKCLTFWGQSSETDSFTVLKGIISPLESIIFLDEKVKVVMFQKCWFSLLIELNEK
ncbi:hypothetical protein, partial [Chryseobacterium carnipullorum]|uniref:hypothetical protein n=1 Tax=Chryseobacterium carnipullorum TaxID=1124835 RepID=UPI001E5694DF